MQYAKSNAIEFFTNSNTSSCPVSNCTVKQPNCVDDYTDGVFIDNKFPFGIFVISDYPDGWIDPICLICYNQNEAVSIEIAID